MRRHPVPDEDFETARKAHEWPRRFAELLREANTRAAAEHRAFEGTLKARRKDLDVRLAVLVTDAAAMEGRGDIIKRDAIAAQV
jgi:hypothetical protein